MQLMIPIQAGTRHLILTRSTFKLKRPISMLFGHPSFPGLLDKGNREAGEPTRDGRVSVTMSGALNFRHTPAQTMIVWQFETLDRTKEIK